MKFYHFGALLAYVLDKRSDLRQYTYSRRHVVGIIRKFVTAVEFLHQHHIAHLDIKTDNILLELSASGQLSPVITDFGVSHIVDKESLLVKAFKPSRLNGMSLHYAAPETILRVRQRRNEYNPIVWTRGDIFSTAILVQEMMTRRRP